MPVNFGSKIRELRIEKNLSQKQLAQLAGIDVTYQSKIENRNYIPRTDTIRKLAQVLDFSETKLLLAAGKVPPEIVYSISSNSNLMNFIIDATDLNPSQWDAIREVAENRLISNPETGVTFTYHRRVREATLGVSLFCYSLIIMGLGILLLDPPGATLGLLLLMFAAGSLIARNYLVISSEYNLAVEKLPKFLRTVLKILNSLLLIFYEAVIHAYDLVLTRIFYTVLKVILKLSTR